MKPTPGMWNSWATAWVWTANATALSLLAIRLPMRMLLSLMTMDGRRNPDFGDGPFRLELSDLEALRTERRADRADRRDDRGRDDRGRDERR